MTKLWTTEDYAKLRMMEYSKLVNLKVEIADRNHWSVKNLAGKIIKPPSYSPPNIAPLIEAQLK